MIFHKCLLSFLRSRALKLGLVILLFDYSFLINIFICTHEPYRDLKILTVSYNFIY